MPDSDYLTRDEPGQTRREWVYASDTTVRAASIDEVLRARAYLLLYEKVQTIDCEDAHTDNPIILIKG